jgi:hypothetical protein
MKSVVLIFFIVIGLTMASSAIFMSQNYKMVQDNAFKAAVPVEITQIKEASTNPAKIRAELKGSIYESGELMTVFGACFDGNGYLLPGSTGAFSAWYPNGTIWYNETPMTSIDGNGRFNVQMTMSDTYGTYLTEMKCMYLGDYALAYGEWQNPDWVKRIKDTQSSVINLTNFTAAQYANLSSVISDFRNEVQVNFSQVLNAIANIDVTSQFTGLNTQLKEIYNQIHALDTSFWVIDTKAPWYSFGSGIFDFRAVDMLSLSDIYAVSDDGYIVNWDGETWSVVANYSNIAWYGVSVLPASTPYAWSVGSDLTTNTSVYSINGGTPATLNGSSGTAYFDVKLFPNPNSPSSNFYSYILENDGTLWYSSDNGVSFSSVASLDNGCSPNQGRLSQVIYNTDLGVTSGYRMAAVMCSDFWYYDGTVWNSLSASNQVFSDVEMVYNNLAYSISKDTVTNELKVWQFNGTGLNLVYIANDTIIMPRGIAAAATNDVWIVTNNPAVYYHYDGFKWEYANYPYSGAIGLSILFTNGTIPGLYDITMYNSKNAYAVGTDGLVMKFYSAYDEKFDSIITNILNISNTLNLSQLSDIYSAVVVINGTVYNMSTFLASMNITIDTMNQNINLIIANLVEMNATIVSLNSTVTNTYNIVNAMNLSIADMKDVILSMNGTVNNIYATVTAINTSLVDLSGVISAMNLSMMNEFSNLNTKIDLLNLSMNTRFDVIESDISYMDLYLNSTIYPALTLILERLGVIETNVNATLQIVNETQITVNQMNNSLNELVNQSRRIHAWVTT